MLLHLGTQARGDRIKKIFADAQTSLKHPRNLKKVVEDIDQLDWFSAKEEGLGDLYEGLKPPTKECPPAGVDKLQAPLG
jgi:type I restriction enzyme M protein